MNMGMVRDLMDIIANGYGNAAGPGDRAIAANVIEYFYQKGWISSADLGFLIKAAGGEIRVSEETLTGDVPLVYRYEDPITHEWVFKTRDRNSDPSITETDEWIRLTKDAKVNPDAEQR